MQPNESARTSLTARTVAVLVPVSIIPTSPKKSPASIVVACVSPSDEDCVASATPDSIR